MSIPNGTRLGPYEILAPLGAGGMGEVYRAHDTRLERDVAIKTLPERLAGDPQALARFDREAKAIAALSHANILSIFDVELTKPPLFLVTELLEGDTLRRRLKDSALQWRRAVEIGAAVAEGLAAAHAKGIVHRDLKPENIFLTKDGRVKILDFGLARFKEALELESRTHAPTLTDAATVMGTVGYMSPEQARGETVSTTSDVFSLGCVLYEMVTSRRAFHRSSPVSTIAAILNDEPVPVTEFVKEIPSDLERWIIHCLKKDPEQRPQSARDLSLILRDLLSEAARAGHFAARGSGPSIDSLAVLPFVTTSSSADADYLGDGITESLINSFGQLRRLKVMARSTVFRHRGEDVDALQVGRDLGVKAVLTGRILQRGETLVIRAELVDVNSGSQLWGQQYKRQLTDIFAIQDEISTEISSRLRVQFTSEEQQRLTKHYTENPEAYELYLKGRYFWNKRTLEAMKKALGYFEQAVECDPIYARAYTGLADCSAMLSIYGELAPRQAFTKAKAAQARALEIDATLGEAHASRGFTLLLFDWDFLQAEQALRHAIELNPGYASAYQWLGFALGLTGRLEEAKAAMTVARQLDPFSASINTTAVYPTYWAHQFDEAIAGFRAAVELHPNYWTAHYFLGLSYALGGDLTRAITALREAEAIGDSLWRYSGLGFTFGLAGEPAKARELLAELDQLSKQQYVSAHVRAPICLGLGEKDQAFAWLERAFEERDWQMAWLAVDPFWDGVRSDSRLTRLIEKTGMGSHASFPSGHVRPLEM
jgi:eukaryotic-like serine/threonine-protein kinase